MLLILGCLCLIWKRGVGVDFNYFGLYSKVFRLGEMILEEGISFGCSGFYEYKNSRVIKVGSYILKNKSGRISYIDNVPLFISDKVMVDKFKIYSRPFYELGFLGAGSARSS